MRVALQMDLRQWPQRLTILSYLLQAQDTAEDGAARPADEIDAGAARQVVRVPAQPFGC